MTIRIILLIVLFIFTFILCVCVCVYFWNNSGKSAFQKLGYKGLKRVPDWGKQINGGLKYKQFIHFIVLGTL